MMKCIIVDDELLAREVLSHLVLKTPDLVVDGVFSNAIEVMKYLNTNPGLDVIFLDIHMPNFSGFDFLQTIKNPPLVILVTNDKNLALEAFNFDCIVDYLVKPITETRFEKAMQRVRQKKAVPTNQKSVTSKITQEIYVNIDKRLIKIDLNSIDYVKANGDYVIIKTETQNYVVHTTLTKLQAKLPPEVFVKTHRSFIINCAKIIDIKDSTVLIGKEIIPVSKNNRINLIERINLI